MIHFPLKWHAEDAPIPAERYIFAYGKQAHFRRVQRISRLINSTAVANCDFSAVPGQPTAANVTQIALQSFCRLAGTAGWEGRLSPPLAAETGKQITDRQGLAAAAATRAYAKINSHC